jgi:hypothetical protein
MRVHALKHPLVQALKIGIENGKLSQYGLRLITTVELLGPRPNIVLNNKLSKYPHEFSTAVDTADLSMNGNYILSPDCGKIYGIHICQKLYNNDKVKLSNSPASA